MTEQLYSSVTLNCLLVLPGRKDLLIKSDQAEPVQLKLLAAASKRMFFEIYYSNDLQLSVVMD